MNFTRKNRDRIKFIFKDNPHRGTIRYRRSLRVYLSFGHTNALRVGIDLDG